MRKLLLLTLTIITFISCKKSSTTDTAFTIDVTAANIAGIYKITDATATSGGVTLNVYNNPSFFPPCNKDDVYTFNAGGTYTIADAGTTCSPTSNFSGTYVLNSSAKTLTLNGQLANIIGLTATTIILAQPNFMGSSATVTATYTRQ